MKKKSIPLLSVAAVCILSIIVMVFALTRQTAPAKGEFTPPPFDPAAVAGTPDVPDGLGYTELDCDAYKVSLCGRLTADGHIWLTNPASNGVWLKARILNERGEMLGETGLVKPGEYVQTVKLDRIPKSGTSVVIKIMAYEPDTYHSAGAASLNTTIH